MRARWRRELDQQERADEQRPIGGALPQVTRGAPWAESTASLAPIDHKEARKMPTQIERGSRVRRIDEPQVLLRVREVDSEGALHYGIPKALCFNSYGHGKWMLLNELEVVS